MKRYEAAIDRVARRFGVQVSRISSAQNRLPVEADLVDASRIQALQPFTMTSAERLWALMQAVRYVVTEGIAGDFVECGVWRGGSVMMMASELVELGVTDRNIWLYDTFAGMTTPTRHDVEAHSGANATQLLAETEIADGNNIWCVAGRSDVEGNVFSTGYPRDNFTFVEGDVAQTLLTSTPSAVAILRLDTDWYESTQKSLEALYPRLSVGGVCILDDYGHWLGARQAVDEYFAQRGARPFMMPIDYSGRMFIKPASHKGF